MAMWSKAEVLSTVCKVEFGQPATSWMDEDGEWTLSIAVDPDWEEGSAIATPQAAGVMMEKSNYSKLGDRSYDPAGLSGCVMYIEGSKKAVAAGGGAGRVTVHFAIKKSYEQGREAYVTAGPCSWDSATSEKEPCQLSSCPAFTSDDGLPGEKGSAIDVSCKSTESGEQHDEATITGLSTTTKPARKSMKEPGAKIAVSTNFTTTDGMGTRGGRCSIAGGKTCPVRADGLEPDGYETDPDEVTVCNVVHWDPECYVHEEVRNSPKGAKIDVQLS